ncbi:MAG TPA: hypothetical protein VGS21_03580, partial [Acidimicrobiales bacterium]|nr:hypothetical protein [Acidimicrobiales bacterium]
MKAGVKLGLLHMGVAAALLFGGMSAAGASETGGTAGPGNSQASSQLVGVSCASTKFCVAVGYRTTTFFDDRPKPFMEMYDGNSWRLRWAPLSAMETGGLLVSVSCPTPDFCAAVGSQTRLGESRSLIEVWNGRTWAVDDASGVPWDSFVSVSCSSGHFCMAVGSGPYGPRIGNTETIAWNGRYWRKVPSPNPPGYLSVSFTGVSCTAGNFCEAVGQTLTEHDAPFAMAAGYDGHRWTMQPLPHVAGVLSYLLSVSCVSRSDCRSVGGVEPNDLIDKPYGLIYDGSRWTNDDPGVMSYNGFGSGL